MRKNLRLKEGTAVVDYDLKAVYPLKMTSKRLRWWAAWRLPIRNWRLLRVFAGFYLLLALMLQVPVRKALPVSGDVELGEVPAPFGSTRSRAAGSSLQRSCCCPS